MTLDGANGHDASSHKAVPARQQLTTHFSRDRASQSPGRYFAQPEPAADFPIRVPFCYAQALASLIDAQHRQPVAAHWGSGITSSSDAQFFRAGGRWGDQGCGEPPPWFGTGRKIIHARVSDQFGPFHTKVIAATPNEAPHLLDGLLYHQSSLVIHEHDTDTGGFSVHVFALCRLLGLRFAPRIRDLKEKRLYLLPQRTRDRILTAARRLFAEAGFEKTTIRAVGAAAAIHPSMVMRYQQQGRVVRSRRYDRLPYAGSACRASCRSRSTRGPCIERWEGTARDELQAILRAAGTHALARQRLAELVEKQAVPAIKSILPADHMQERLGLIIMQISGLVLSRYLCHTSVTALDRETIVRQLGAAIQVHMTSNWVDILNPLHDQPSSV